MSRERIDNPEEVLVIRVSYTRRVNDGIGYQSFFNHSIQGGGEDV